MADTQIRGVGKLVHWGLGTDWSTYDPFHQVLCVAATKTQKFWNPDRDTVALEEYKHKVTCPECKEWMHA
jgi:hypothetical protein